MKKSLLIKSVLALAAASPLLASAESQLTIGTGSAVARLDLRVIVPRVLFLGVGTGATGNVTNTTINQITFDYSTNPLDVGSTGVAAGSITNTGPTPAGSSVPVRVVGNNGQVTITATNPATLTSGTDSIPFSELSVTSSNAALPPAAFSGGTSLPTLTAGTRVTNQTATWTYSYANSVTAAAGTYTGRVTYTATMP